MSKAHINGIDLYYELHGKGDSLLFIHGLGSSTRDWELQVNAFKDRYRVITLDLRGHGKTDKPEGPYSISLFANDIVEFLESQKLAPAHVTGISLGGVIALQLALDHPELVRSLVLVNSFAEMVLKHFRERVDFWMRIFIVRLLGMRKMGKVLAKRLFPNEDQVKIRNVFVQRWAENDTKPYLLSLKSLVGWSVADRLESLEVPTLVLSADQDYTPVEVKEAYVSKIPNAELVVIKNSRHATPVDQPEKFNSVLKEFLEKLG